LRKSAYGELTELTYCTALYINYQLDALIIIYS